MAIFDIYAFSDYSGAADVRSQKKAIAVSVITKDDVFHEMSFKSYTRESLRRDFQALLIEASRNNQRVIFGFDHSYSFPIGFYELVTDTSWGEWTQLLDLLWLGKGELAPIANKPREWAEIINKSICTKLNVDTGGPFWGPHFHSQIKDPKFKFETIKQKRLAEERIKRTKPIYKIGGIGSVGLQSLYGIKYIAKLRNELKRNDVELFCWPFDGWELPSSGHVLVEIYPGLFNQISKGDIGDATSCSVWIREQDRANNLPKWFEPKLNDIERKRARLEGWIFGVL